jgi:hypothetical protein
VIPFNENCSLFASANAAVVAFFIPAWCNNLWRAVPTARHTYIYTTVAGAQRCPPLISAPPLLQDQSHWWVITDARHCNSVTTGGWVHATDAMLAVAGGLWRAALRASLAITGLLVPATARHFCSSGSFPMELPSTFGGFW